MDIFSWQNEPDPPLMAQSTAQNAHAGCRLSFDLAGGHSRFVLYEQRARHGGSRRPLARGYGINPNFNSYVGSEIDLVATYAFKRFASLQAGSGHFFCRDYVKSSLAGIGGTRDATFVYSPVHPSTFSADERIAALAPLRRAG